MCILVKTPNKRSSNGSTFFPNQAMLSTLIDATDSQCHRSRMEVRRVGKSIDGNYLYFDKNLQQAIFQVSTRIRSNACPSSASSSLINWWYHPNTIGWSAWLLWIWPPLWYFGCKAFYKQWLYPLTIEWTFPRSRAVFISGFFSQREGVLGRYAPLLVTVHQCIPLMPTTVVDQLGLEYHA